MREILSLCHTSVDADSTAVVANRKKCYFKKIMKLLNWLFSLILLWCVHDVFQNGGKTIIYIYSYAAFHLDSLIFYFIIANLLSAEAVPQFPMGFPGMFNPIKPPFMPFFTPMPFPTAFPPKPTFPNPFGFGGSTNSFAATPNPFSFFGGFKNPFFPAFSQPAAQFPPSVYPQPNWNSTATPQFRPPTNPAKSSSIKVNVPPSSTPSSVTVSTKITPGQTYIDPVTELKHDDYGGTRIDLWGNFADNAVAENGQILLPNIEQNPPPLVLPNSAAPDDVTQPF